MSTGPVQKAVWSLHLCWVLITPSLPDGETGRRGAFPDLTNAKHSHFLPPCASLMKHGLGSMCIVNAPGRWSYLILMAPYAPPKQTVLDFFL